MSVVQSGLRRVLNPWSNPNLRFGQLYRMDKNEILNFIENLAERPQGLISENYRTDFRKGSQAIIQILNEQRSRSKYFLDESNKPEPLMLQFEGHNMKFHNVYDTLGYLMTVAGPAPQNADKDNYLYPMGQLFSRWSNELAQESKPPTMGSVVHVPSEHLSILSVDVEDEETTPNLTLSASLPKGSTTIRDWVQGDRLAELERFFNVKQFPDRRVPEWNRKSQLFGHCAETDPLIMASILVKKGNVDTQKIQGFAIDLLAAGAAKAVGETLPALPDCLRNPCLNCQFLIRELKCDPTKFHIVGNVEEYETTAQKQASSTSQASGNKVIPTASTTASSTSQASGNKAIPTANKTASGTSQDLGNPVLGALGAVVKGVVSAKPHKP